MASVTLRMYTYNVYTQVHNEQKGLLPSQAPFGPSPSLTQLHPNANATLTVWRRRGEKIDAQAKNESLVLKSAPRLDRSTPRIPGDRLNLKSSSNRMKIKKGHEMVTLPNKQCNQYFSLADPSTKAVTSLLGTAWGGPLLGGCTAGPTLKDGFLVRHTSTKAMAWWYSWVGAMFVRHKLPCVERVHFNTLTPSMPGYSRCTRGQIVLLLKAGTHAFDTKEGVPVCRSIPATKMKKRSRRRG